MAYNPVGWTVLIIDDHGNIVRLDRPDSHEPIYVRDYLSPCAVCMETIIDAKYDEDEDMCEHCKEAGRLQGDYIRTARPPNDA